VAIDRSARRLELASGETVPYAQLALATGARARRLALPGAERAEAAGNFHYLRTLDDARRLRPQLEAGARIVIVGGGYIGLELAALAIKKGLKPVVLEALPRVLARVTAAELSVFYEKVHRDAGVELRTGVQVTGFEFAADGRVAGVAWQDAAGATGCIETDIVVAGVGVVPNIELAQAAGLACAADGLLVDALCRTSDAAIVAAGDCTSRPVPGQPGTARIESVPNAAEQARAAAATLCGLEQPCSAVPWFWSDQYDLKLQMVGLSRGHDAMVLRGDMTARALHRVLPSRRHDHRRRRGQPPRRLHAREEARDRRRARRRRAARRSGDGAEESWSPDETAMRVPGVDNARRRSPESAGD
jgi:3-phenylpropionate/trans-cinnamate dioxygenase ferredoxin reductase subunit